MRKRTGPKGPDIRDVKPTIVLLDARLTINGGTLSNPEIIRVWNAVKAGFESGAFGQGLGCSWVVSLKCVMPKVIDAQIERDGLFIEHPRVERLEP